MNSNKNLRTFLQGIQFYLKAKGFKLHVYAPSPENRIIKSNCLQPNVILDVDGFNLYLSCYNDL